MTTRPSLDPIAVSTEIETAYRRYLTSSFGFRDADRQAELDGALTTRGTLAKGPILQAAAPYATSRSVDDLVEEGVLSPRFRDIAPADFPVDRPLYQHQEDAIRQLVGGRNLMVATGTGSGKTECFLLPIVQHLLSEVDAGTIGQPGVRALLLYPMNALANDQLKRLRTLLAAFPEITFGRYVGDTEAKTKDANRRHLAMFGEPPQPNELVSREQMQERPPHILLTNFAMLEYLLLRPADSAFFDGDTGRHWHFIVLDEVHVYDGAKGAEVGMLLRRVRSRINGGKRGELQTVGTSATLGEGDEARRQLAHFGSQLFDEPFAPSTEEPDHLDVVEPLRKELVGTQRWTLDQHLIHDLADARRAGADAQDLAATIASGAPPTTPLAGETVPEYLHRLLVDESHVVKLQTRLEAGSGALEDMARLVFTGDSYLSAAVDLVELCLAAQAPDTEVPMIPARYHLLVRSLEGAFRCRSRTHPQGAPRLRLARNVTCPACAKTTEPRPVFELASCRKCGSEYLCGELDDDERLVPASDRDKLIFLSPTAGVSRDDADEDEDEAATTNVEEALSQRPDQLCVACGRLCEPGTTCDCSDPELQDMIRIDTSSKAGDVRVCVDCGGRSNTSIVLRVLTGSEAPVSVLATSLYQALPEAIDDSRHGVGAGRKLLSFADSVQDAAFFAPYLQRTYGRAVERRLIWETLNKSGEPESVDTLATPLRKRAEREQVLDEDHGRANRSAVAHWVMREILAVDRRQSLEGVGLAEVAVEVPRKLLSPAPLVALGLDDREVKNLAHVLLDSLRLSAAVTLPDEVDITDPIFSPRNVVTTVRESESQYGILAWSPGRGLNRRLDYLTKVLAHLGSDVDARKLLADLWSGWFTNPQGPWTKVLRQQTSKRNGVVYAIDHEQIVLEVASPDHRPSRCDTCHQIWWRDVRGVCPTYRCPGSVEVLDVDAMGDDHYRHLYTQVDPIGMTVREHTGQLESQYAGQLQQEFITGKVNVLSCSTTFELGVDVGDVQSILMRNMPPSPANYVQRAGRAGRRAGSAPLVLTFAQRRNHDLHYFDHPRDMVEGRVSPPIIEIKNAAIARRHVHAVAYSAYCRHLVAHGEDPAHKAGEFFNAEDDDTPQGDRFLDWLSTHPADLLEAIETSLPHALHEPLGLSSWAWVDRLTEHDSVEGGGWFDRARSGTLSDLVRIDAGIEEAKEAEAFKRAGYLQAVRKTVSDKRVIDVLAQQGVLPKYGFPVDVATLDLTREGSPKAARLDLSRDLSQAVAMYAPGNKIVAGGALWQTVGLKKPTDKEFEVKWWGLCKDCNAYQVILHIDSDETPPCRVCSSTDWKSQGKFVVPSFGFIGAMCKEKPGERRPPALGTSDVFFDRYEGTPPTPEATVLGATPDGTVQVRHSRSALITVVGRSRATERYALCQWCGHLTLGPMGPRSRRADEPPHENPSRPGQTCEGYHHAVHLGHQYLTDAVELQLTKDAAGSAAALLSTLHSLLAASRAVGITRDDMQGSTQPITADSAPALVLFDDVPGGAGHARHLSQNLPALFRAAFDIVNTCECGEDTSCYGCLRTYRNQFDHDDLRRGAARDALKRVLA